MKKIFLVLGLGFLSFLVYDFFKYFKEVNIENYEDEEVFDEDIFEE